MEAYYVGNMMAGVLISIHVVTEPQRAADLLVIAIPAWLHRPRLFASPNKLQVLPNQASLVKAAVLHRVKGRAFTSQSVNLHR